MPLTTELLRRVPKVLLHDHLDGGLRPATIVELAKETGYDRLPTLDSQKLAEWFQTNANRGSLPLYLQGFEHTCCVMQTEDALERVAYEYVEDMYRDGIVYIYQGFVSNT